MNMQLSKNRVRCKRKDGITGLPDMVDSWRVRVSKAKEK